MTTAEQFDLALKIGGFGLTAIGAVAAAVKYFDEQRQNRETRRQQQEKDREARREQQEKDRRLAEEELAWRKTQFVFQLAQDFDQDSRFQRAVQMLLVGAGVPAGSNLARILAPRDADGLSVDEKQARYDLDRYLDFFDRMYYFTCVTKALSIVDVGCFDWYVLTVSDTPALKAYAEREGYQNVLKLADQIKTLTSSGARAPSKRMGGGRRVEASRAE